MYLQKLLGTKVSFALHLLIINLMSFLSVSLQHIKENFLMCLWVFDVSSKTIGDRAINFGHKHQYLGSAVTGLNMGSTLVADLRLMKVLENSDLMRPKHP